MAANFYFPLPPGPGSTVFHFTVLRSTHVGIVPHSRLYLPFILPFEFHRRVPWTFVTPLSRRPLKLCSQIPMYSHSASKKADFMYLIQSGFAQQTNRLIQFSAPDCDFRRLTLVLVHSSTDNVVGVLPRAHHSHKVILQGSS